MIQSKSFKIRIYPNRDQQNQINRYGGCVRFVYNYFLNLKINEYTNNKRNISFFETSSMLTQLKNEEEFNWLYECPATALLRSLKDLDSAYNNFFRGLKKGNCIGYPKFKSKRKCKLSFRVASNNVKLVEDKIKIVKLGILKYKCNFNFDNITKINNATITRTRSGKYFISLCCQVDMKTKPLTGQQVGIDLGIKQFATLSNEVIISNPKFYNKYEKKLVKAQRKFSKMKKGSNNREKQRIKLNKIFEKITNCRLNFIHNVTSYLVNNFDLIAIEDLDVSQLIKNNRLAKSISDASFYEFRRQLEYKCKWYGKKLVVIDRFFPSSKLCSNCNNIKEHLTLNDREYICDKCGLVIDRDLNASINILTVGITGLA